MKQLKLCPRDFVAAAVTLLCIAAVVAVNAVCPLAVK